MTPRIAIGLSVYNEAQYLPETIPAILNQTLTDFALLIHDNGSTDESAGMLEAYAAQDARIILTRSDANLWPPVVANQAMALLLARFPECRWFLAAGADDVMAVDYLEVILRTAALHPSANCIFSPWEYIGGVPAPKRFPAFDPSRCHDTHMVPAWRAVTRELWDAVGPENEAIRIGSDWEWPVRAREILRPIQLDRPYLSLRVRGPERKSQSDEVEWRSLYRHLCRIADQPIAGWAC